MNIIDNIILIGLITIILTGAALCLNAIKSSHDQNQCSCLETDCPGSSRKMDSCQVPESAMK